MRPTLSISSSAFTHQGHYRQRNEDALLDLPDRGLFAVCDGMGGHDAGDYASRWIVDQLASLDLSERPGRAVRQIRQCLDACNSHLLEVARTRGLGRIGSTVVLMLAAPPCTTLLWAGDSRAYRQRDGRLRQMTQDHSYAAELARETGLELPPSGVDSEVITRAVGASDRLRLDSLVTDVRPGDCWLLCSDGVSGVIGDDPLLAILSGAEHSARQLVDLALTAGSRDNCSAIVVSMS